MSFATRQSQCLYLQLTIVIFDKPSRFNRSVIRHTIWAHCENKKQMCKKMQTQEHHKN